MGKVGASLELPHPPDRVFRVATRVADMPRWLPEVVSAELLDPTLEVGSRVRLKLGPAVGGLEVTGAVRQLRAPSILVIGGAGGPVSVEVRARLDPTPREGTRIALEIRLSASPMLGFIAREAERRINAELAPSLERLRTLVNEEPAEGGQAG
jgi:uncharacterized protein YndB with AHSA1/START domain